MAPYVYVVELTPEEYHHLLRIAPDGIQAAMTTTQRIRYLEQPHTPDQQPREAQQAPRSLPQ